MYLRKLVSLRHTLAFRLTLWYAVIFTLSSCVAFLLFYMLITSVIRERTDQELLGQVGQFSTILAAKGIETVKRVAILEAQAAGVKKIFFRLLYPNGQAFSSSNMSYWKDISIRRDAIERLLSGSSHVLETIDVSHAWQEEVRAFYHMGTPAITTQSKAVNFDKLVEYLDESVELIESALEKMSDEQLEKKHSNYRGEKSRYEHLTSFHWHEAFHIGQLEVVKAFVESKR